MQLPNELWKMIFDLSSIKDKYTLSHTCKFLHSLKPVKPNRYYCLWNDCSPQCTSNDYEFFYFLEDCLIRSKTIYNQNYVEIGIIINDDDENTWDSRTLTSFTNDYNNCHCDFESNSSEVEN